MVTERGLPTWGYTSHGQQIGTRRVFRVRSDELACYGPVKDRSSEACEIAFGSSEGFDDGVESGELLLDRLDDPLLLVQRRQDERNRLGDLLEISENVLPLLMLRISGTANRRYQYR